MKINPVLSSHETMSWLKQRFMGKVKDQYILNKQELKEQVMMKAVFNSIDRDKSKFLDRGELYDMFKDQGIQISKQTLKEFFQKIDQDEDDKLNWNDFKLALTNQEALTYFVQLMRKIRASDNSERFVPLSFPNMIQYMNYCVQRQEYIQLIESKECTAAQKVQYSRELLSLEENCFRNIKPVQTDDDQDIAQQSKKTDHRQLIQLKRIQETQRKEELQSRIRKLSNSNYYIEDKINTDRLLGARMVKSLQDNIKTQQQNYKSIVGRLTQEELPDTSPPNLSTQLSRLKVTENCYTHRKEVKRGSHFINQYFLHLRNPSTVRQRITPLKRRVQSQVESLKTSPFR